MSAGGVLAMTSAVWAEGTALHARLHVLRGEGSKDGTLSDGELQCFGRLLQRVVERQYTPASVRTPVYCTLPIVLSPTTL